MSTPEPAVPGAEDLADVVRRVLAEVGGVHPAIADDSLVATVPGLDEPWISGPGPALSVRLVVTAQDLPARPRLVRVQALVSELLDVEVRVVLVDVVSAPPDDSVDEVLDGDLGELDL